jgi:hypothetical protein
MWFQCVFLRGAREGPVQSIRGKILQGKQTLSYNFTNDNWQRVGCYEALLLFPRSNLGLDAAKLTDGRVDS